MKLTAAINRYVLHRQATGEEFQSPFVALQAFSRRYSTKTLRAITPAEVKQFLDGLRTVPATWRRKYATLRDFFAYWSCRGKQNTVPMPATAPKYTQTFVPYIYSRRELRLLLEAVPRCQRNVECRLSAATPQPRIFFAPASTSTPSAPGSATSPSTPPTSTRKRTSR
jgi:integrase/recombinase XerD